MHNYLRAIGFSKIYKNQIEQLMDDVVQNHSRCLEAISSEGTQLIEYMKEYGNAFGISVCGEYKEDGSFRMEYYYPYFYGSGVTTQESVEVEKHAQQESYAGICDEVRLGVTLIFYLQNMTEYLNAKYIGRAISKDVNATMSALSIEGKILLPISKNDVQIKNTKKYTQNRSHLIAAARDGDEEAIESLTLEDIDTYSMLSRRIMTEDVLSIVDTTFMPYGIESDQYSIIAEILDYKKHSNTLTKENIYIMTVECNHMIFDLCINEEDLLGEPAVGRRFKGNIWMQGRINFYK